MVKESMSNYSSYNTDDEHLKLHLPGRPRQLFPTAAAKQQHLRLLKQGRNKRYKEALRQDPGRVDVLTKCKATKLKWRIKRYADYSVIAQRIAPITAELQAMHARLSPIVKANNDLKTVWDQLVRKEPELTSVCAAYKQLLASVARNFSSLHSKAEKKTEPHLLLHQRSIDQQTWFNKHRIYKVIKDLFVLAKAGQCKGIMA